MVLEHGEKKVIDIMKRAARTRGYALEKRISGGSPLLGEEVYQVVKHVDSKDRERIYDWIKNAKRGKRIFMPNKLYLGYFGYKTSEVSSMANQTSYNTSKNRNNSRFEVIFKPLVSKTADGDLVHVSELLRTPWAMGDDKGTGVKEPETATYVRNGGGGAPQSVIDNKDGSGIFLQLDKVYEFVVDAVTGEEKKVLIFGEEKTKLMKVD